MADQAENQNRSTKANEKKVPRHKGLFPPLVDDEIAELLDSIVADRHAESSSSRTFPTLTNDPMEGAL